MSEVSKFYHKSKVKEKLEELYSSFETGREIRKKKITALIQKMMQFEAHERLSIKNVGDSLKEITHPVIGRCEVDTTEILGDRSDSILPPWHGNFMTSITHRAKDENGKTVAVKCFSLNIDIDPKKGEEEFQILRKYHCKNLVCPFDLIYMDEWFWLFMEHCDHGDLENYFVRDIPTMYLSVSFMCDMAAGLQFLHERQIIHGCIKPRNILISESNGRQLVAKLSDAFFLKIIEATTNEEISSQVASSRQLPAFMAPEIPIVTRNESVDVFALGVTYWFMITFQEKNQKYLAPFDDPEKKIEVGSFIENMNRYGSTEAGEQDVNENSAFADINQEKRVRKLICRMLVSKPEDRLHSYQVKEKMEQLNYKIGEFQVTDRVPLAAGSYTFKVINTTDNTEAAAKEIKFQQVKVQSFEAELDKLKKISSTNDHLVRLYDCKKKKKSIWLFMEYCQHRDLETYFSRHSQGQPGQLEVVTLMTHMAEGVNYLHENGLIHMNIKPQNVLIKSESVAKIADFGLSEIFKCNDNRVYWAPEQFYTSLKYSSPVDIFSLGLIYFAMICFKKGYKFLPNGRTTIEPDPDLTPVGEAMEGICEFEGLDRARDFSKDIVMLRDQDSIANGNEICELIQSMITYAYNERIKSDGVLSKLKQICENSKTISVADNTVE